MSKRRRGEERSTQFGGIINGPYLKERVVFTLKSRNFIISEIKSFVVIYRRAYVHNNDYSYGRA